VTRRWVGLDYVKEDIPAGVFDAGWIRRWKQWHECRLYVDVVG
jgi:hypothetical protein